MFNSELSSWDVSNVKNLENKLNSWDVSRVVYMYRTFDNAAEFQGNTCKTTTTELNSQQYKYNSTTLTTQHLYNSDKRTNQQTNNPTNPNILRLLPTMHRHVAFFLFFSLRGRFSYILLISVGP